jgi:methanethiol S-methyltransferase
MFKQYLFIAFLWAAYCALHSYLISTSFTKFIGRILKKYFAFYRIFYIVISVLLLIPLINYTSQLDSQVIIRYGPYLSIVRYMLILGSLAMFFWAFFFDYDALSFFGVRQIMGFWRTEKSNSADEIKKNGLLGLMRHPMYLALIVYLWCQTIRAVDILVNVVLTVYIIIGTRLEEKKLVLEFGEVYKLYQQEVPMLIPYLKVKI